MGEEGNVPPETQTIEEPVESETDKLIADTSETPETDTQKQDNPPPETEAEIIDFSDILTGKGGDLLNYKPPVKDDRSWEDLETEYYFHKHPEAALQLGVMQLAAFAAADKKKKDEDELGKSLLRKGAPQGNQNAKKDGSSAKPKSIQETKLENKLTVQELKKKYFSFAREKFQGKSFSNIGTGEKINVSRNGLDEWYNKTKSREQALSIKLLDDFLTNGKKTASNVDNKHRDNVEGFDYYERKCKISGNVYNAILSVKKTKNNPDKYYHHFLQDIKLEPRSGNGTTSESTDVNAPLLHGSPSLSPVTPEKSSETLAKSQKSHKQEPYLYPIQQDLADKWELFFSSIFDTVYVKTCKVFGLPDASVRLAKANTDPIKYNGRIVYNPDTGKPINQTQLNAFIKAVEGFMNAQTKDAAKKIVLDNIAIQKIIRHLAKYQTTQEMKKMALDTVRMNGKTFEQIAAEIGNIKAYQSGIDYIAQKIVGIEDATRNGIKDTLLWNIRNHVSKSQTALDLFEKFGAENKDWKRIVDTESVNLQNKAYCKSIAVENGNKKTYLKRFELEGACPTCKSFDGAIALYSDTPLPDFEGDDTAEYAVWDGKEPTGKNLVMGVIHPNCRGSWLEYVDGMDEMTAVDADIDGTVAAWDKAVMKARADNPDKDYTSAEMYDVIMDNYRAFAGDKAADSVLATKRKAQKTREARMKKSQGGFNESEHPRGNPDNAGQFTRGGGGMGKKGQRKITHNRQKKNRVVGNLTRGSIEKIFNATLEDKEKLKNTFYKMADTPQFMKDIGVDGDFFSVRYGMIARHIGKDDNHNLSIQNWVDVCGAIKKPFAIAEYKNSKKQKAFRLFTEVKLNGNFIAVGVDVYNGGTHGLNVNKISTAFGFLGTESGRLVYTDKKITPEQAKVVNQLNSGSKTFIQEPSSLSPTSEKKSSEKKQRNRPMLSEKTPRAHVQDATPSSSLSPETLEKSNGKMVKSQGAHCGN